MLNLQHIKLQYVTDDKGQKQSVILPIEEFIELVEDIEDLAVIAERRDEPTIPFEQVIAELKRDGLLPD
jgi:hypothetical protein